MRRGEKAGTRSHLSLLSHCWRQSQQTLRDGGGGGYEALFREELASLSLKRNTVKSIFPSRKDDSPCLADDASPWPFYFSPTYPSLRLSLPGAALPLHAFIFSPPYLHSLFNFLYVLSYCFLTHFVKQQINLYLNFRTRFLQSIHVILSRILAIRKKKIQRMEAPIEQLVNILIYYRKRDLSTRYILLMLFSVKYIYKTTLQFLESQSVSSRFRLLFSLLQFFRRFFLCIILSRLFRVLLSVSKEILYILYMVLYLLYFITIPDCHLIFHISVNDVTTLLLFLALLQRTASIFIISYCCSSIIKHIFCIVVFLLLSIYVNAFMYLFFYHFCIQFFFRIIFSIRFKYFIQ